MTFPSILLGFVIASLYGALFHLWRGGGAKHLGLYLLLAWLGFFSGHFLAAWRNLVFIPLGSLNLGFGSLGAIFVLFAGLWLSKGDAD